ncbi:response regulator [Chitinibacter sp. SCUT-21]|uniref:hybrid sensor histidine kinase/response regulator n=1 Tax=Chitinibacter sp. SCUT-21 TaxID=2970891 RepID=UPI0035A589F7
MLAESSAAPLTALATAIDHCQSAQSTEQGQASLQIAIAALHELAIFAEQADQAGLWSSCNMLAEQIKQSAADSAAFTPPAELALVVANFAIEPSQAHAQQLLELMSDAAWSAPLAGEDLTIFADWLTQDSVISSQLLNLNASTAPQHESPSSEQWLNDLAELEASAALIELEELDVLSMLDDIGLLLNSDWSSTALCDSLLAVSIAAQTQHNTVLDTVSRYLLQSIHACEGLPRAVLTEQLPLLLLDASMIAEDDLNALLQRIDALFLSAPLTADKAAPAANTVVDEEITLPEPINDAQAAASVNSEMLAILHDELALIAEQMNEILGQNSDSADDLCELLERLEQACAAIGMHPLANYLQAIQSCVRDIAAPNWLADYGIGLVELAPWLSQYCTAPHDEACVDALMGILLLLGDTREAELEVLRSALLAQTISTSAPSDWPERQKIAAPADVSLAVPDDISAELMEGLLQELPIQAGAFAQAMQKVVSGRGTLADLDIAKRAAHTLKGAANTVGIAGVANLTHHLEDILIALSEAAQMPDAPTANLLTEAGDCLESMAEALMGAGPTPSDSLALFQRILDCANHIDTEGIAAQAPIENSPQPIPHSPTPPAQPEQTEQIEAMVRIPARLVDEMLNLLGESIVSVAQMRELLAQSVTVNQRMRAQNQTVQHLVGELEQRIEARSLGQTSAASHQDFDSLEFESYNELHSISRRLTEATTDSRELALETEGLYQRLGEAIEAQHRLQVNNQEVVMRTRMVPVSTIEARLQRAARQTARLLDKEVALSLQGETTLVDSHLLNTIIDPLMHVLRNAIDHGIEAPELRAAKGKAEQGQIALSFAREGNSIVVRCKDDGAGLDLPAIRRKAERIGIITPDTTLSHNETARLILRHGFSIRDEASQVSGRGIGMDIVLSTVNALKGNLILHSEQATGLQIEMRFPVSLVASHALLVESQQQRIAISSSGILDLAYFESSEVLVEDEQRYIQIAEHKIPLLELESIFGLPAAPVSASKSGLPAIVLQLDSGALKAVQVQRVIDSRDIVVKDLGQFVPRIPGVLGATILGDGGVASVVDLRELLDNELIALNALQGAAAQESQLQLPRALVVDDSISARRATTQVMRDAGFEVRPALDGLDAIEQLENWLPDIVLVDMEMPRMNGLELAAYFRSQAHLQHIPIIMITSRSTEKHRRQATLSGVSCYLVKPFNEEVLLNNAFSLLEQQQVA